MASKSAHTFSSRSRNVLCRYYIHGACDKGNTCPFSHDRSLAPSMTCRYYQNGTCRYGDRCRYDHIRTQLNSQQTPMLPGGSLSGTKLRRPGVPATKPPFTELSAPNQQSNGVSAPKSYLTGANHSHLKHFDSFTANCKDTRPTVLNPIAKEFSPGTIFHGAGSYVSAVTPLSECATQPLTNSVVFPSVEGATASSPSNTLICPFVKQGKCPMGQDCTYLHGDVCEWCTLPVLHPYDKAQRAKHIEECQGVIEQDMKEAFRFADSLKKECGICMDVIMEKQPKAERRFGIMSDCTHVFCLACIRKWRKEKNFDSKTIRSCPECRVVSDFVTPSDYWVETREEKEKLIKGYKDAMKKKHCHHFKRGKGECPFNDSCFYKHAYPDGRIASPKPRRRKKVLNASGDLDLLHYVMIWDLLGDLDVLGSELADIGFDSDYDDSSDFDNSSIDSYFMDGEDLVIV